LDGDEPVMNIRQFDLCFTPSDAYNF